jgi:hypothetical protein
MPTAEPGRTVRRTRLLQENTSGARILDGYQTMLDDPEVDAVYMEV